MTISQDEYLSLDTVPLGRDDGNAAETKAVNPEQHGDDYDHQPRRTAPYPINGVCDSLGVGRTKVYELINQHELVQVSIGRRSFVTTESLRGYVDRLAEAASA